MSDKTTGLARLREPFEPHQINKLPKPYKKDSARSNCRECGGYHGMPAVHLDYVGHAALTDRLLEVDPEWSWEPLSLGPDGLPVFDNFGGLWIRLSICGVNRLGYGDAMGKNGSNAVKEAIGDALRNAGMRFGAALDLWHKGDLHDAKEEQGNIQPPGPSQSNGTGPDWNAMFTSAKGDRVKLEALRNQGRTAGLPDDFGMFGAIEYELKTLAAAEPIEGKIQ